MISGCRLMRCGAISRALSARFGGRIAIRDPSNRHANGEHALCESPADDYDRVAIILVVERVEIAAGGDGNAKCCKISRGDNAPPRAGILQVAGLLVYRFADPT